MGDDLKSYVEGLDAQVTLLKAQLAKAEARVEETEAQNEALKDYLLAETGLTPEGLAEELLGIVVQAARTVGGSDEKG